MTLLRAGLCALALVALAAPSPAAAAGKDTYDAHCGLCHQGGGKGVTGQFPRLAARVDRMAEAAPSRTYLVQAVLHGVAGRIEVDGAVMVGVMPPFAMLSDKELADVLNYVVRLGPPESKKVAAFKPQEVATVRAAGAMSASAVLAARKAAAEQGLVP